MDVERVNKLFMMKGPNLVVNGSIIKGHTGYETIVLSKPLNEINRLDVKCRAGSGIRMGITPLQNINIIDYPVGMYKCQYSYRFNDGQIFNDATGYEYGTAIKQGDIVSMRLRNNELLFEVNGECYGCAFNIYPSIYHPAISLFNNAEIDINYI